MKRLSLLAICLCLAACATTEPRVISNDESLEREAQRNEVLADVAERSGSPQAAKVYRDKAAENRAAKKAQPSVADHVERFSVDLLFSVLMNALERAGK